MANSRFEAIMQMVNKKALKTLSDDKPFSVKFGINTFNESVMLKYLPNDTYKKLKATIETGEPMKPETADVVAHAIKEWALFNGATHFTHWFQPMTGLTAEKHDAFIHVEKGGKVIERFSGKELVQGEPDASSFPSGGLRATFEARGYTIWDPVSPAFIIESPNGNTLCIPSIFISYSGESLGKKAPLLKSIDALEKSAIRLLKLFGNKSKRIKITVGGEQEYFLIDKTLFNLRPDLVQAGRALFGGDTPKGQQLEDHYFGSIKPRVLSFMMEVEDELVKLGIPVKTRHNEVAPNQFEIAPIFEESSIACDHNQITMEVMRRTAIRHDLALLLHEKPFAGINGSGKHNNWSFVDEFGNNLLEPGSTPHENLQFLICLLSVIRSVKKYGHLLRASVASAGNDHRLGANEAPPAIMSVFIGSDLMELLDKIENEASISKAKKELIEHGLSRLPVVSKDNTDRNRTSPFAFTGNKFEFRAVGSSASLSTPNLVLNAMVAESLDEIADRIGEKLRVEKDFKKAVLSVVRETITEIRPVIFNGDNYSKDWEVDAEKRGLINDKSTPESLKRIVSKDSIELFTKYKIFTESELKSRHQIHLESYIKTIKIEAMLTKEIALNMIIPSAIRYANQIAEYLKNSEDLKEEKNNKGSKEILSDINKCISDIKMNSDKLLKEIEKTEKNEEEQIQAEMFAKNIIPLMNKIRENADCLESVVDDSIWPLPKFREMLFLI